MVKSVKISKDTERLNWITENNVSLFQLGRDWNLMCIRYGLDITANTPRQVIDNAMKKVKEKTIAKTSNYGSS